MSEGRVGVIGGSGLYALPGIEVVEEPRVATPYGEPSDRFVIGRLEGREVVFLARHGRGHRLLPSELNYRANIFGMKVLGVDRLISVCAVGSLREEIAPGELVVPDQFIDRTRHRPDTFYGDGVVVHVGFADPMCPSLRRTVAEAAAAAGGVVHRGGCYLCMEGPQFSTRAESTLYRQWGVTVIGMTNLQEAKLAREAEICFATLALVTDYDCWHTSEESVNVDRVLLVLRRNAELAQRAISHAVRALPARGEQGCTCGEALRGALITEPAQITEERRRELWPLLGRYLGAG